MGKKIGAIVLIAAISIVAGIYYWQNRKPSDSVYFAEYLPKDTLAVMSLTHMNRLADTFSSTPLGHFLAKETMAGVFAELNVQNEVIAEYNQTFDDIASLMGNPAFQTVFGDDTAVGLLSPDLEKLEVDPEGELQRNFIVFATTAATGALEKFAKLLVSDTVVTDEVAGRPLTRITLDNGDEIWGYADNGIVLLAFDPDVIATGLDAQESGSGLAGVVSFGDAVGFWEPYTLENLLLRTYINVEVLRGIMEQVEDPAVKGASVYLTGIRYLASVTHEDSQGLHSDAKAGFTSGELHEVVQAAIAGQAPANTTLHLLRDKCLVYDWASTLIPEVVLNSSGAGAKEELQLFEDLLQRELGVSLDELFKAFGPQYGFTVNEIVNGGFIPIPKVAAFVQVRDHGLAEKVFAALRQRIERSGLATEKLLESGENTIHYWSVLPGEATQPAMALTSDMFYLANGKSALADLLGLNGEKSKVTEEVAGELGEGIRNNLESARLGAFVVYPARIADEVDEVAEWIINTVAATQGVSVERLGSEIIRLLEAYEVFAATSTLTDESALWRVSLKRKAGAENNVAR